MQSNQRNYNVTSNAAGTITAGFKANNQQSSLTTDITVTHSGNIDIDSNNGYTSISANPVTITAGTNSTVTVTLSDEHSNPVNDANVEITVTGGSAYATVNNGDGTYSAPVTLSIFYTFTFNKIKGYSKTCYFFTKK